jgi:integrase
VAVSAPAALQTALADPALQLADRYDLPALLGGDPALALRLGAAVLRRGGSPRTAEAYGADLAIFGRWLLGRGLGWRDLAPDDLDTYAQWLRSRWTLATARRRMSAVRGLYAEAHRLHLSAYAEREAPAILRGDADSRRHPALGLDDTRALFARLEARVAAERPEGRLGALRDRALLALLFLNGLRRAEAAGARVEDLTSEQGHTVLRVRGKGRKARLAKLPPLRVRWLRAWIEAASLGPGDPLFVPLERGGRHLRDRRPLDGGSVRRIVRRRLAEAGLPVLSAHSGRATFVTLALKGGAPLHAVQMAAGHADARSTERYADLADLLDDNATDYIRL